MKVLITSRPHLEICHGIEMNSLCVDIYAQDSDIKEFLAARLNKRKHLSSGLKERIIRELSGGADGMYHIHCHEAERQVSIG